MQCVIQQTLAEAFKQCDTEKVTTDVSVPRLSHAINPASF
ncbi:hypothetical protein PhaeoP48_01875 [Phaeobacter inhibens]|nr:hypothetical protein PhaeoP59_01849 [Phaeobacter inhibens]AUR11862.1 hypothetical protein PhaeoP48_01875 [Phaeobacter inhibens]